VLVLFSGRLSRKGKEGQFYGKQSFSGEEIEDFGAKEEQKGLPALKKNGKTEFLANELGT